VPNVLVCDRFVVVEWASAGRTRAAGDKLEPAHSYTAGRVVSFSASRMIARLMDAGG
jgi:hypothetical protein